MHARERDIARHRGRYGAGYGPISAARFVKQKLLGLVGSGWTLPAPAEDWVPGDFRVWHGSSPDVPPLRRESFYVELKAPATRATFTTTFAPARK
jgi:hypothetical protein